MQGDRTTGEANADKSIGDGTMGEEAAMAGEEVVTAEKRL